MPSARSAPVMSRSRFDLRAQEGLERVDACERRVELLDVGLIHAVHPVEPARVVGRDARQQRCRHAATGQQRRARERMRPATRPAERAELVHPELVEQRRDVVGDVADAPPGPLASSDRSRAASSRSSRSPESGRAP